MNIKEDAEAVVSFCREELRLKGSIGAYGRSLGGLAATHLATFVDMIIIDRSFQSLHEVAYHMFHGSTALHLFKIGALGWGN